MSGGERREERQLEHARRGVTRWRRQRPRGHGRAGSERVAPGFARPHGAQGRTRGATGDAWRKSRSSRRDSLGNPFIP